MANVDIDPLGEDESRPEEPTDEHIPLDTQEDHQLGNETEESKTLHSEENLKELSS